MPADRHAARRAVALLVAVVLAVVAALTLSTSMAVAGTGPAAQTRVAAFDHDLGRGIGSEASVWAGGGRGTTTPQPATAVGSCVAPQTSPDDCESGRVAVDANALIQAIDFGNPAVDVALAGRRPVAPPPAAQEYLVKGSQAALTGWLTARGGGLGSPADPARARALQTEAQSLGRALSDTDAEVAASAIQDGLTLLTRDEQLYRFMQAAGYAVERW